MAEPAGYLLYSLQAEPEGEAPHGEFWRATLDGSDRLRLLSLPPNQGFKGLAVSPDGMQFAYVVEHIRAERNDLTNLDRLRLLQLDTAIGRSDFLGMSNGSADAPLDEGVLTISSNAFSPDGSQFVFVRPSETNPTPPIPAALWVTEASRGAVPRRVTADYLYISQPAWLDDETLIFSPGNLSNVFTLNIRESSALIPDVLVDGAFVALSPDRTRLLVRPEPLVTKKPDQPVPYALISLAGETPEVLREWQLPPGKFVWSPDGTMLAQSDYAGVLRVLHLEDGTTEELLRVDPGENVLLRAWSADSRSLIYTRDIRDGTGGVIMPRELYRLNVADATSQLIISGDSYDFRRVLVVPPQPGQEP
jgi:dipeptidyl aminopeptidase/acylaminoacyl peptidase